MNVNYQVTQIISTRPLLQFRIELKDVYNETSLIYKTLVTITLEKLVKKQVKYEKHDKA